MADLLQFLSSFLVEGGICRRSEDRQFYRDKNKLSIFFAVNFSLVEFLFFIAGCLLVYFLYFLSLQSQHFSRTFQTY